MPKLRLSLFAGACLLALAGSAAAESEAPAAAPVAPAAAPSIIVATAKEAALAERVVASGLVQAVDEVDVQPQVEGLAIDQVLVDVGDRVAAGQVLAVLSSDALLLQKSQLQATRAKTEAGLLQIEAQIAEAKATADEARRVADRTERLAKAGTLSESQVTQAASQAAAADARLVAAREAVKVSQAEMKVADAQIADTELKLQRTEVRAPVAGIVSGRNARIGAIASGAGQPLYTLIRDGEVELRADVAEADVGKLHKGQEAEVALIGRAEPVKGKVRLVEPTINTTTRLGVVRVGLGDAEAVKPGQYARADIVVRRIDAVLVPIPAVTSDEKGTYVLAVEGDRVHKVPVVSGTRESGMVEIVSGLAAGKRVVAKAGAFVRDGDRINPVEAPAGADTLARR